MKIPNHGLRYGTASLMRIVSPALFAALSLGLGACTLSGPPPSEYVLGIAPTATASTIPETRMPVIAVKRVRLPDYLDSTDLLMRKGNAIVPSPTGRWSERLSIGVTRGLVASLSTRLPGFVVTASPALERPMRQVQVDLDSFESQGDGQVVLVARWSLTNGHGGETLIAQRTSLVEPIAGFDDGAVVAAMTRAIDRLADQIAGGIDLTLSSRTAR